MREIDQKRGMIHVRIFLCCVGIVFSTALAGNALSQDEEAPGLLGEEPYLMNEMVVTEETLSEEDELKYSPHHVSVIRAEEFEGRFTTVEELLAKEVGVKVSRTGGVGDFSSISIRGSTGEQVTILLDGVPLNSALGGAVNLGTLPVSNVESVEVYRGSSPNRFGLSGIGGVVNIRTKKVKNEKTYLTQVHYGSYNTFGINGFLAHKPGNFDYVLASEYVQSDNDFKYLNTRGTSYNKQDDRWEKRENNDYRGYNGTLRTGYDYGPFRFELTDNVHWSHKGLAGSIGAPAKHASFSETRNLAHLTGEYFGKNGLLIDVDSFYAYKLEELDDHRGEVGGGNQDTRDITQNMGSELRAEYPLGKTHLPSVLGRISHEKFSPEDELNVSVPDSERTVYTLTAQDKMLFFDDRLIILPSLKYDHVVNDFAGETLIGLYEESVNTDSSDKLTRQLGILFNPFSSLTFKGNIGVYYRFPSFFELFGNNGTTLGNPDLGPEKGFNRDIGISYDWKPEELPLDLFFEVIYFNNKVEDLIAFEQATGQVSHPCNVDDASIKGWEFVLRTEAWKHLQIEGNVTYQDSVNEGPVKGKRSNRLPRTPLLEVDLTTSLKFWKMVFEYEFEHMQGAYLDLANLAPSEDRYLHHLTFTYTPREGVSASFQVQNLTDEHYQDFYNYPLPGRSFFFTLKISDFSVFSDFFPRFSN